MRKKPFLPLRPILGDNCAPSSPSLPGLVPARLTDIYLDESSEVSAKLEFLNQENLILSIENKALKQRLESVAHKVLSCESKPYTARN
ncbi:hypothetical protein KY289_008272 [Solanum tuberosum]|nr:hypothetical protein KY289_008272 [Solanum tuberosum]